MKKFKKGQVYQNTCWFTGGQYDYVVTCARGGKVWFSLEGWELDGPSKRREVFDLKKRENGDEYVVLYEYHGHENAIEAEGESML